MISFGILLIVFGFGSLILNQFGMEFRIMSWATDMQPWIGILVGLAGVALVVLHFLRARRAETASGDTTAHRGDDRDQGVTRV